MKLTFLTCLMALLFCCGKKNDVSSNPPPVPIDPSTIFSKRTGHVVVEFKEKLWLIAGANDEGRKNDVWSSEDGLRWKREIEHAAFSQRNGHQVVKQNNKLWLIGGFSSSGATNDIWSSADGISWVTETSNATFSPRAFHQVAVFKDKFWLNGGISGVANGDFVGFSKDIWTSADGKNWERSSTPPFEARFGHNLVNFKGKLWFMGGHPDENGDVWSSEDGISWVLQTARSGFGYRNWASVVVYKEELWLIGGHTFKEPFGGRMNDVWSSSDGKTWRQRTPGAAFSASLEHKTVIFKDMMFVIGGDAGQTRADVDLKNDVWFSTDGIDWKKGR